MEANLVSNWILKLIIRGYVSLVFDPHKETGITADHIIIRQNGSLVIGSEGCTFNAETEIAFTGEIGPDTGMGHYTKGLAVEAGGSLEIHGQKKLAWTRLTHTLSPTSAEEVTIRIEDNPVGWEVGDRLVIASTDFDMNQVNNK